MLSTLVVHSRTARATGELVIDGVLSGWSGKRTGVADS
jgi:hypothetical protein